MPFHCLTVLSLATAALTLVSAQDNQCFYAANKRAGSIIVPCSSTGSYASCCQLGDICLSDSACWNPQYNVTYLYGCTDPNYTDFTCPYKCGPTFADAPYVGLDYCSNTTNYEWSCTHPKNSDEAIQPFDFAAPCLNDSIIAFAGPVSLPPYLSLPQTIGGSTLYFSPTAGSYTTVTGYTPTTTAQVTASVPTAVEYVGGASAMPSTSPMPSTGSTTSSGAVTSASTSTMITSSPISSSNTGLKVGLGVGIVGGVLFFAAFILFFLMWRRRRQRHAVVPQHEVGDAPYGGEVYGGPEEKNISQYQNNLRMGPGVAAAGGRSQHHRQPSELAADNMDSYHKPVGSQNTTRSTQRSPVPVYSEFEGSSVPTHTGPYAAPQLYELGDSR